MTSHELPLNSRGFTPLMPLYLSLFIISSRWPDYDIWADTRIPPNKDCCGHRGQSQSQTQISSGEGEGQQMGGQKERRERESHRLAGVVASPHISESVSDTVPFLNLRNKINSKSFDLF